MNGEDSKEKTNTTSQQIDWKNLLSLKEAARLSGYHQDYLSYLIRNDELHGIRIGKGGKWFTTTRGLYDLVSEKKPEYLIRLAADERFQEAGADSSQPETSSPTEGSNAYTDQGSSDTEEPASEEDATSISQFLTEQEASQDGSSSARASKLGSFFNKNKIPVITAGIVFIFGLIGYLGFLFVFSGREPADIENVADLPVVEPPPFTIEGAGLSPRQLSVNGTLRLGGPLVMQYSDAPEAAEAGQFYLDSDNGQLHIYDGDAWEPLYFEDEDFLASLITEDDLSPFITIDDIPAFATPEDLASVVTLDDLEDLASLDDLEGKVDLQTAFPGASQTGNINISGTIAADVLDLSLTDGELLLGTGSISASGTSVSAEEVALLSGRGGELVDSLNVSDFALTGITSGSGMELLADGVSLVTECGPGQVLKWNGTSWDCGADATGGSGAPTDAEYVVLSTDGGLSNERTLSVNTDNLSLADGGAGSSVTLDTTQGIATSSSPHFAGLSLGTPTLDELLTVDGRLSLLETTSPSSTPNRGKLYVKSSDGELYFMDSSGTETNVLAAGSLTGTGSDGQVTFWSDSNTITGDADFSWDDTEKRLGIGTTTPEFALDVLGTGRFAGELTLDTELGVSSGGTGVTSLSDIAGTSNQISVSGGAASIIGGDVTLSLPQDIDTSSSPQFGGLSLGTSALDELLTVDGRLSLLETTSPSSTPNYGKLFVKSSDNELYFTDSSGDEINISGVAAGSLTGTGSDGQVTFWTGSNTISGDTDFFWDNTDKNLGIGVPNPTSTLAVSGDVDFKASGGGAGLFYDQTDNRLGLGTIAPNEFLTVDGRLSLLETTSPTSTPDYGKLFVKSSDNELYFMNSTGTEVNISGAAGGGLTGTGSDGQVTFWTASNAVSGSSNFFWDNAESRLGIGTNSPSKMLSLGGPNTGLDSPATSTLAFHSDDVERLRIGAEGNVGVSSPGGFSSDYSLLSGEPGTPPSGSSLGADFSANGTYLAFAHDSSPFISIYKKDGDAFNSLSTPSSSDNPPDSAREAAFSPDETYLAVAHATAPFVTIYKRDGDAFDKLPDPADLPAGSGRGAAFSPNGRYLVVSHDTSPFVTIYKRDGDTFEKLPDPAELPPNNGRKATFSPDGAYLVVGNATDAPFVTIYKRDGDTFEKLPDPADEPLSHGFDVAFSPDGAHLVIAHAGTPFITIYKRDGDTFEKLPDPATAPPGTGNGAAFSSDGNFLTVAHNKGSHFTVYERDGDTYSALPSPPAGDEPAGDGNAAAFSPEGAYLAIGNSDSPSATMYKGGGSAVHALELASHGSSEQGLAIGKELKLYRSRPGVLSLASGSSFSVDEGNLYVGRNLGIGTDSPMGLFDVDGHFVVRGSGLVGIATSTPQTELHVAGTIRQTDATDCDLRANASGDIECIASTEEVKKNVETLSTSDYQEFLDIVRSQDLYSFLYDDMNEEENPYIGILYEDTPYKNTFFSKENEKFRTMNYISVALGAVKALAEDMENLKLSVNEQGQLVDGDGNEVEGSESVSEPSYIEGVLSSLIEFSETRFQSISSRIANYFGRTIDIVFADNSVLEQDSGSVKTYSLQTSRQEVMINGGGELRSCSDYSSENHEDCEGFIEYIAEADAGTSPAIPEEDEVVAVVMFHPSFSALLDEGYPVRVFLTPTDSIEGNMYIAHRSIYGFVVMQSGLPAEASAQAGGADLGGSFDWMAVARISDGNNAEVETFDKDDVISDEINQEGEEEEIEEVEDSPATTTEETSTSSSPVIPEESGIQEDEDVPTTTEEDQEQGAENEDTSTSTEETTPTTTEETTEESSDDSEEEEQETSTSSPSHPEPVEGSQEESSDDGEEEIEEEEGEEVDADE